MPPGTLMEDAVILEPRALGPSVKVEFNCLNITTIQDFGKDLHTPGVGAGGWTTAPKMTLGACIEAEPHHFLWPVSQRISGSPRGDQAAFLLLLSHPVRARSGCCSQVAWEVAGGETARDLEGGSNTAPWWYLLQMGWFFIHLRQWLANSLLQWKSSYSEHLCKSLGGLLYRDVRLQRPFLLSSI